MSYKNFFAYVLMIGLMICPSIEARKIKNTLVITKDVKDSKISQSEFEGSQIILSDTFPSDLKKKFSEIMFAGFEKEPNSTKESFILVNNTDEEITGFEIKIDYLDMQDRMLHSRVIGMDCMVPPGESRKFDIRSWDTQRTYFYYLGNEPKRVATPFKVKINPISFYIK